MPWYFVQHFRDPLDQKLCTYVRRLLRPCWRWLPLIGQVSVLQQCNGRKSASTEMLLASRAKVLRLLRSQTGLLMISVLQEILAMFGLSKTVVPGSSMYVRCIPPHLAQGLGCVSRTARAVTLALRAWRVLHLSHPMVQQQTQTAYTYAGCQKSCFFQKSRGSSNTDTSRISASAVLTVVACCN